MIVRTWVASVAALVFASAAHAELGGSPTWSKSGSSGIANFSQSSAGTNASYTVDQTTLPSGAVVREYVSGGTVFAIAWHGSQMPPLNTLLGAYFPSYLQSLTTLHAANGGGYGPANVQQSDLVVQTGGHMGSFAGRAYLPQALPQGVSTDDIQ
jgi:Protein of unknown function (DUF2844)